MSTFYARVANAVQQETLSLFCKEFSPSVDHIDAFNLKFNVEAEERIRVYLNFDVFIADTGIKAWMIEGPSKDQLMQHALDFAQLQNGRKILTLSELFILADQQNYGELIQDVQDLIQAVPDEMLKTADMYVLSLGNARLAAHELYLHRNTFNYRMRKFTESTQLDLRDPNIAYFYQWIRKYIDM